MSLERAREELDDATEKRFDKHMCMVHIRFALYQIIEYLELQSLEETTNA